MKLRAVLATATWLSAGFLNGQENPGSLVYSGDYQNGAFQSLTFVNNVVGWDTYFSLGFRGASTVIGNIEAGHVWFGHEAFVRPPGAPNSFFTHNNPAAGALDEIDFHATTVGHVLAGSGYFEQNGLGYYSNTALGMAPESKLVSGAIASGFSTTQLGSFSTGGNETLAVYQDFFTGSNLGAGVAQPDVINSSWGGSDPAANSNQLRSIDGLARENPSVAFVVSAGNAGPAAKVSSPASGFNNISVGSTGGASFLTPSSFSSSGLVDFHNPETGQTLTGVRAAVDIAAPGERMFLAAYLGDSGGIGAALPGIVQEPSPTNQYFLNLDGTSYASPIVAGGIALLKDAAKTDPFLNHLGNDDAFDTRVIKSVLMASAKKTEGWNNGQNAMNVTTQALDTRTGAGMLDLTAATDVYFLGTRELAADGGGLIAEDGWDSATIDLGGTFEYVFSSSFTQAMSLSVALNWFSVRSHDDISGTGSDLAFSDLDLEVWTVDGTGQFLAKVGESVTDYNNTEFLRFDWLAAGRYGFRVVFDEMVFDLTDAVDSEYFGLAWNAVPVPEPSVWLFATGAAAMVLRRRRV
jgi:hypothetical protein